VIIASLSDAARKAVDMELDVYKFLDRAQRKEYRRAEANGLARGEAKGLAKGKAQGLALGKAEGRFEGKAEGLAKGKAQGHALGKAEGRLEGKAEGLAIAVTTILEQRRLKLTAVQRRQILECKDQRKLESWLKRASSAGSVAELLASHARTVRSSGRRNGATAARARRTAR
jgi:predicted transposase YdaD